jgi:hypothetical protein
MPRRSDAIFQVGLEAALTKITGMDKVSKAAQKAAEEFRIDPKSLAPLEKSAGKAAGLFFKTIGDARATGLFKDADRLEARMGDIGDQLIADTREMAKIQAKLQGDLGDDERARLSERFRAVKEEAAIREKSLGNEIEAINKVIKRRSEAMSQIDKVAKMSGKDKFAAGAGVAEGFLGGLAKVDPSDMKGMVDGFIKGMGKAGGLMEAAGGARAAKGAAGGATMARAGASMAAAAGSMLAVAGVLAAVVALIMAADKQTKEWNKALLEGAGAADLAGGNVDQLTQTLRDARKTAVSLGIEFRQQPEDIVKIIAKANEAGFTYAEMAEHLSVAGDRLEAFNNLARTAIIHAQTLGVSTDEIADSTALWMHDFGGGLKTIEDSFGAIYQGAMESGIGAKRFYGMVTQASAGLALYNARIEDTAALVALLGESLGEAEAANFVQGLGKGFAAESYTDRYKRFMLTGEKTMVSVTQSNAKHLAETFVDGIKESGGDIKQGVLFAFHEAGFEPEDIMGKLARGDAGVLKQIMGLSAEARQILVGRVMETDAATGRGLQDLIGASEAMSGTMDGVVKSLDEQSMGAKLALTYSQMGAMGLTDLADASPKQLAMMEQQTSLSGEQLHEATRSQEALMGQWLIAKQTDKSVGSFHEWLISQGDDLAERFAEGMSPQEYFAKQMVRNTESVASILKGLIAGLLEEIAAMTGAVRDKLLGLSQEQSEVRDDILKRLKESGGILQQEKTDLQDELSIAMQEASSGKTFEDRASAKKKVAELDAQVAAKDRDIETHRENLRSLQGVTRWQSNKIGKKGGTKEAWDETLDFDWSVYGKDAMQPFAAPGPAIQKPPLAPGGEPVEMGGALWSTGAPLASGSEVRKRKEETTLALQQEVGEPIAAQTTALTDKQHDEFTHLEQEMPDLLAQGFIDASHAMDVMAMATALYSDPKAQRAFSNRLAAGGKITGEEMGELEGMGHGPAELGLLMARYFPTGYQASTGGGGSAIPWIDDEGGGFTPDDFISRGGKITRFNSADEIIAGKEGGPLSAALGGPGGNVNINIHGGDTKQIYSVVKKAMRESGVRPPAGGRKV